MSAATSVRDKQAAMLRGILGGASDEASDASWRVLIYDMNGRDIVSPLLPVAQLRELGIAFFDLLHTRRDQIAGLQIMRPPLRLILEADAPAVYFVMPTEENIKRICEDMEAQLYGGYAMIVSICHLSSLSLQDSYQFNFIAPIPRRLLETLASTALDVDAKVAKVYDVVSMLLINAVLTLSPDDHDV